MGYGQFEVEYVVAEVNEVEVVGLLGDAVHEFVVGVGAIEPMVLLRPAGDGFGVEAVVAGNGAIGATGAELEEVEAGEGFIFGFAIGWEPRLGFLFFIGHKVVCELFHDNILCIIVINEIWSEYSRVGVKSKGKGINIVYKVFQVEGRKGNWILHLLLMIRNRMAVVGVFPSRAWEQGEKYSLSGLSSYKVFQVEGRRERSEAGFAVFPDGVACG